MDQPPRQPPMQPPAEPPTQPPMQPPPTQPPMQQPPGQPPSAWPGGVPPGPGGFPPGPQGRPLAEWWKRLVAIIIDGIIVGVPASILMWVLGIGFAATGGGIRVDPVTGELTGGAVGPGFFGGFFVAGLVIAVLSVAYYVYFNGNEKGQTVGKMAMKIQVRDEQTGGPIGYGRAFARWLIPGLSGSVTCGLLPILDGLWPLWDSKRQALHDKVARSIVVDAV